MTLWPSYSFRKKIYFHLENNGLPSVLRNRNRQIEDWLCYAVFFLPSCSVIRNISHWWWGSNWIGTLSFRWIRSCNPSYQAPSAASRLNFHPWRPLWHRPRRISSPLSSIDLYKNTKYMHVFINSEKSRKWKHYQFLLTWKANFLARAMVHRCCEPCPRNHPSIS